MKKKDFSELKAKNVAQLRKMVGDLKRDLSNLSIELSLGKLKNQHQIKTKKKDIAKALTLMSLKQIEEKLKKGEKAKE